MAKVTAKRQRARWWGPAAAISAGAILGAVIAPGVAAAAPEPPPWFISTPGSGEWAAYEVSGTPSYDAVEDAFGPLTLTLRSNADLSSFAVTDTNGDSVPDWPESFTSAGITFQRSSGCSFAVGSSCQYYAHSNPGDHDIWLAGGDPPGGDASHFDQFQASFVFPGPEVAGGATDLGPGQVELQASVTNGGSVASYEWHIGPQGSPTRTTVSSTSSTFTPDPTLFPTAGTYCASLTVHFVSGSVANSPGESCFTVAQGSQPAPGTGPGPAPGPGPTPGGDPGGVPTPSPTFFAAPSVGNRSSSAPVDLRAANPAPVVQWLWRPEWYQPTPAEKQDLGKGVKQNLDKVALEVDPGRTTRESNAAPLLAGLMAFGFGGAVVVFRRRRQVRALD